MIFKNVGFALIFSFSFLASAMEDSARALCNAVLEKNSTELEILLQDGANPNEILCPKGIRWTSLMCTSRYGDYYIDNIRLLLKHKADPNFAPDSFSPLMIAAANQGREAVKLLLAYQADPNYQSKDGETALMAAAHSVKGPNRNENITKAVVYSLLKTGADISLKNNNGETAVDIAKKEKLFGIVGLMLNFTKDAPTLKNICKKCVLHYRNVLKGDFNLLTLDLKKELQLIDDCCAICYEDLDESSVDLACGHNQFHLACLEQWKESNGNKSCPICRAQLI